MALQKLKGKDFITIAIFTVLIIVIDMIISMPTMILFGIKFSMIFGVGIAALLTTGVYMLMAAKVKKPGVMLLQALLRGLIFSLMSSPIMLLIMIVPAIIAELFISIPKKNDSLKYNGIAWGFATVIYSLHGVLIFHIMGMEKAVEKSKTMFTPEQLAAVVEVSNNWLLILASILVTALLCFVGYFIGKALLKKNFEKAGVV